MWRTDWERCWWWKRLKAEGEGDDRKWDGWMASPTLWTWVWASSGSWWWTGKPGMLQLQRVRHDWVMNWLNWQLINNVVIVSNRQQKNSAIHIHVFILLQTPLLFRMPHNCTEFPFNTVGPHWLSILNIAVCKCIKILWGKMPMRENDKQSRLQLKSEPGFNREGRKIEWKWPRLTCHLRKVCKALRKSLTQSQTSEEFNDPRHGAALVSLMLSVIDQEQPSGSEGLVLYKVNTQQNLSTAAMVTGHKIIISSVQFSHSVVSDSLRPHELQHTMPPCPSPTPRVHPNPCPLCWWCHPAISSSVIPFSSCLQSCPASGSFQMSQLSASGGQSIGVSASISVPPMNIQDWSPLGWTGWISLQSKGLSRVFSNTTVQKHKFSGAQLSL